MEFRQTLLNKCLSEFEVGAARRAATRVRRQQEEEADTVRSFSLSHLILGPASQNLAASLVLCQNYCKGGHLIQQPCTWHESSVSIT